MSNQPSAAEIIASLQQQLTGAQARAYEARSQLEAAETEISQIKQTLQGAVLGQKFEQGRAAEANKDPEPTDE